jgi:hypothetical protein
MNTTQHNPTPTRLKEYGLSAVAIVAGVAALAPQEAEAAIIPFSDSGSFIEGTVDNGDQATISIALGDGTELWLDSDTAGNSLSFQVPFGQGWDATGQTVSKNYFLVPSVLPANSSISINTASTQSFAVKSSAPNGTWTNAFTDQFIGFSTVNANKGYLKVSWNPASGVFSYNGGALENTGASLLTGALPAAVPEPGTLALLVAGAAVMARRRRPAVSHA